MTYSNARYINNTLLMLLFLSLVACETYLETDVPDNRIISETVFNDAASAESAVQGVYNQLSRAFFVGGGPNSISVLAGLSADNLRNAVTTQSLREFEQNEISVQNSYNYDVWTSAYNIIYQTNAVLEGLQASTVLSLEDRHRMEGEIRFIRGFVYFYLVNLYGEVPLVLGTDYRVNATVSSTTTEEVYGQIIDDLETADNLLGAFGASTPLRANANTVKAFLGRVHLYLGDWEAAEHWSGEVIGNPMYAMEGLLNEVFLVNSTEAIWQISPESTGTAALHTRDGNFFILEGPPYSLNPVELTPQLLDVFEEEDDRLQQWIGSFTGDTGTYYFPYKYKVKYATTGEITEYTMVLRLAEQYLIRAEARAQLGNTTGAIADLDVIRERAGLALIEDTAPNLPMTTLIDSIVLERRRELFTEWGHRWLDLKRLGRAGEVLAPQKALWESTDVLYPIAEEEINKNPELEQNPGY